MIINQKRSEVSLPPLKIAVIDLIQDEGQDDKISSTHFRKAMTEMISGDQLNYLKKCWEESTENIGMEPAQSQVWLWKLFKLYSQSWRKYHTLQHIRDLCEKIDKLGNIEHQEKGLLKLAAFFHDAIYVPSSKLNEVVRLSNCREVQNCCLNSETHFQSHRNNLKYGNKFMTSF